MKPAAANAQGPGHNAAAAGGLRGSLWMLVAGLMFACMAACVKLGSVRFNAAELVFWRGAFGVVAIGSFVAWRRERVVTPLWPRHLARSISGCAALILSFLAIHFLPLATAYTLSYTSPLWLAVLVAVLAHERLHKPMWGALGLGLVGVAFLLKPSLGSAPWYGSAFGLAAGALSGVAYLNVRKLGEAGEPEWRTVFWFSVVCALCGLPFALANLDPHWSLRDAAIVLGVGGFGALGQLAMTRAYTAGRTLFTAALSYSTVVFAAIFGVVLFDDSIDLTGLIGIAAVVASGVLAGQLTRKPVDLTEND